MLEFIRGVCSVSILISIGVIVVTSVASCLFWLFPLLGDVKESNSLLLSGVITFLLSGLLISICDRLDK